MSLINLLIISINVQLNALVLMVNMHFDVDWVAADAAIIIKLLVAHASVDIYCLMVAAMRATDGLAFHGFAS